MQRPLTTNEVARRYGIAQRTVRLVCAQHGIGMEVSARLRLLSEADARRVFRLVPKAQKLAKLAKETK